METVIKSFSELTTDELFEICKLRVSVFIVEQQCPYQDIDEADRAAYHVCLRDGSGILAYLRVLPAGAQFDTVGIGRVIAVKRRMGYGSRVLAEGIKVARERLGADVITVEAQTYARGLYEKAGFRQVSEEFLEDGIPHIRMELCTPDGNNGKGDRL